MAVFLSETFIFICPQASLSVYPGDSYFHTFLTWLCSLCLCCFCGRVSLCVLGRLGTCYVDQAGLDSVEIPLASAFRASAQVKGLLHRATFPVLSFSLLCVFKLKTRFSWAVCGWLLWILFVLLCFGCLAIVYISAFRFEHPT